MKMLFEFGFLIRKGTTILALFWRNGMDFFLFSKQGIMYTEKWFAKIKYGYNAELGFDSESMK
jgi:hypothetical protein